jgi:hypothetical protein
VAQVHQPSTFHEDPVSLFLYPLRLKGLVIFGFVFAGLMLPLLNLLTYLLLAGYLVHVLTTSANGGMHLPDFPEFKNIWHGLLVPCGLLAFTFALSNAPLILYVRLAGQDASSPLVWLLTGVAVVVFPIIAMTTVITRSVVDALNFFNLLRIVRAIGVTYRLLVVYLAGILAVQYAVTSILDKYELLILLDLFIQVYTWFVVAHLLGRAIHETRGQVEWGA